MTRGTDWTGDAGNGSWFDPGNWDNGVPGASTPVLFYVFGETTPIDVSLAPAQFHHPVAGSVRMLANSFVFEPGRLTIRHGGMTITGGASLTIARGATVDARNPQGGDGVKVGDGALAVQGALHTDHLAVLLGPAPGKTRMLVSGPAARVTVAGTTLVDGTSAMAVEHGAHFATDALKIDTEGRAAGAMTIGGAGTLARVDSLTLYNSNIYIRGGAQMLLGGGSEAIDPNAPSPGAYFGVDGGIVQLAGLFTQKSGFLEVTPGGHLVLQAGSTLDASGYVALSGGTITGPGSLVLAGGWLEGDEGATQVLNHSLTLSGSGTLFGISGTLTVNGAIAGADATLNVFSDTGSVELTNPANSYGSTNLHGTLILTANDVTGSGPIRFMGEHTLVQGASPLIQSPSLLVLAPGVSVGNTLLDFGAGDLIDLAGIHYSPRTTLDLVPRSGGGATMTVSDGTHAERLVLGTVGNPSGYSLSTDGNGGTEVSYAPPPPQTA